MERAALAAKMAQRRAPSAEVERGVLRFAAAPEGKPKRVQAFGVAVDDLVRQRAEIVQALNARVGGAMTWPIASAPKTKMRIRRSPRRQALRGGVAEAAMGFGRFDKRRRTASLARQAPQAIAARIGEIVRTVSAALLSVRHFAPNRHGRAFCLAGPGRDGG